MGLVSPKQVAMALGVSESSLKRWCDRGLIATTRTAGGHRRLSTEAVVEFLRNTSRQAVRPELLGLPSNRGQSVHRIDQALEAFFHALVTGDEDYARRIVLDLHMAGERVSNICDGVIAATFHHIGDAWACGDVDAYQERRACGICQRILDELRGLLPAPGENRPLAIGGAPEGDAYTLPTAMIDTVLRQCGWRSQSLGSRLPFPSLLRAIDDLSPRLLWISASHLEDVPVFLAGYREFRAMAPANVAIVVGGRALTEDVRRHMEYACHCDSLQHLEGFVRSIDATQRAAVNET